MKLLILIFDINLGESTWTKPDSLKSFEFGEPPNTEEKINDGQIARFINPGVNFLLKF